MVARKPTMATSRLQPTCMLGIAAYGLKRIPATPPLSWPAMPTVSAIPSEGTRRGGAVG